MKQTDIEMSYVKLKESDDRLKILKTETGKERFINSKCAYEYRIKSAGRVLRHIRDEYRTGRLCDLETLLRHCQDKLNGSIDGIELELKEGKSFRFEKDEQEKTKGTFNTVLVDMPELTGKGKQDDFKINRDNNCYFIL